MTAKTIEKTVGYSGKWAVKQRDDGTCFGRELNTGEETERAATYEAALDLIHAAQRAADLREKAKQHEQDAADSFERCDTDGFVSQWASGLNAQKARMAADIEEAGGVATFRSVKLVTLDGEATDARAVKTRYGMKWRLDSTDEWLAYRPARESTLAQKGYREVEVVEVAPARADTWAPAGARGLAGATQVTVTILRDDVRVGLQAEWHCVGVGDCKAEYEAAE